MDRMAAENLEFLKGTLTFRELPAQDLALAAESARRAFFADDELILEAGAASRFLFVVMHGGVELRTAQDSPIRRLTPGEEFGVRALRGDGRSPHRSLAVGATTLLLIPGELFRRLESAHPEFSREFDRIGAPRVAQLPPPEAGLLSIHVRELMGSPPVTIRMGQSVGEAARLMKARRVSCLPVLDAAGEVAGVLTDTDLRNRVLAQDLTGATLIDDVMTPAPIMVDGDALAFEALLTMTQRDLGHLLVTDKGRLAGVLSDGALARRQTVSAVYMASQIARKPDAAGIATVVAEIPKLLTQLVGGGADAHDIGLMITSISDAATRRLIALAQERLGPAPVGWVWAACGSQGRQEQTAASDQDNALILADEYDEARHGDYFRALAKFVSDGLHQAGYVYCPGDMMATNPRWLQPRRVWRSYFLGWITTPDPEAQMLASVMFDLRAIAGDEALLKGLQEETLAAASGSTLFVGHMVANSLKHTPPLGFLGGISLIRSGEHKNQIDLKMNGVVPVIDIGRVYALRGAINRANTRERIQGAADARVISEQGARDLLDAFTLIADARLAHQARLIRAGRKPDNFLNPDDLSGFERRRLKDAFGVVKTTQSTLGGGGFL